MKIKLDAGHIVALILTVLGVVAPAVFASLTPGQNTAVVDVLQGVSEVVATLLALAKGSVIVPTGDARIVVRAATPAVKMLGAAFACVCLAIGAPGCTAAQLQALEAKVEAGDAFAMDLTNAACSIGEAIPSAAEPTVMLVCDVLDVAGAVVAHYAGPTTPEVAAKIVKRHPAKKRAATMDGGK